jgi:hypothetical protein
LYHCIWNCYQVCWSVDRGVLAANESWRHWARGRVLAVPAILLHYRRFFVQSHVARCQTDGTRRYVQGLYFNIIFSLSRQSYILSLFDLIWFDLIWFDLIWFWFDVFFFFFFFFFVLYVIFGW